MDIKKGLVCGLTDEKPNFIKRCENALFNENFEQQLIEMTYFLKLNERDFNNFRTRFIFNLILSVLLIISGIIIFTGINLGYVIVFGFGIGGFLFTVGIILLSRSVYKFNRLKTFLEISKNKEAIFNSLADIYGFTFQVDLELLPEVHGETRFTHYLFLNKNRFFKQ